MLRRIAVVSVVLVLACASGFVHAAHRTGALSLGVAGTATQAETLSVAAPLTNLSDQTMTDVTIARVRLGKAPLSTSLPIRVDDLAARSGAIVQADFIAKGLTPGKSYAFVVEGSYRMAQGKRSQRLHRFKLTTPVAMPSLAVRGSGELHAAKIPARHAKGGRYPPQRPRMGKENLAAPPVPDTPSEPAKPTPTQTGLKPAPAGDPPSVTFDANDAVGFTGAGIGCSGDAVAACAEPSGASGNGVIFVSANWNVAYSTDGGSTFTVLDPTTIFPNDAIGFCCDQIIQYAPSIDRFIWLLQGTGYRLAMASPADIKNSHGTAWTYWNLTPSLFGKCAGPDYPDLSIGDHSLYISWDAGGGGSGCSAGFQVVRTSLAGIQAAGTITLEFTDPANAPVSKIWGEHLTQNTGDEIFWAGHNGTGKLTVYSLKEGSNTYFWRDVGISGWANNAPTSTSPDGQDWLAKNFNGPGGNSFPRNGIIGAARAGNALWFGWTAGTDKHFKQAHIEIVTLDRANNFHKTQQVQVWNNDYAFAYPAFSSNGCTNELGMSFEYGGNGHYENHVVGFWGDFIAYITTHSDVGTDRYGDYVTLRRAPVTHKAPGNLFTAFGFGVNKPTPPQTRNRTDVRYVLFGRPSCHSP